MRRKPSRITHEGYNASILTDPNTSVQPVYRAQSIDVSGDYATETLMQLADEGYVEIKEDTPVFSFTLSGNQVATEIDDTAASEITALQWLVW